MWHRAYDMRTGKIVGCTLICKPRGMKFLSPLLLNVLACRASHERTGGKKKKKKCGRKLYRSRILYVCKSLAAAAYAHTQPPPLHRLSFDLGICQAALLAKKSICAVFVGLSGPCSSFPFLPCLLIVFPQRAVAKPKRNNFLR